MPWGQVIGGIAGGLLGNRGAKKAAKEQAAAMREATAEQRRQYDQSRADQAPFMEGGVGAFNQLLRLYGLPTAKQPVQRPTPLSMEQWSAQNPAALGSSGSPITRVLGGLQTQQDGYQNYLSTFNEQPVEPAVEEAGAPDFSSFFESPDYRFALDQGTQATERSAAARGGLNSGNTLAELTRYGQGLATQNFGNYTNRLASLAGAGQTATNALTNAGLATGQGVANSLIGAGNARASGIINSTNAWGNALNDISAGVGDWWQGRQGKKQPGSRITGPY